VAVTLRFVSLASVALAVVPGDALAFQIETPITYGCHEKVTVQAHRTAGYPDGAMAPEPTDEQDRASRDLIFTLPADEGDLWTMTMLIGVRFNDIKDYQVIDPASLLNIHDDPEDQPAHCIRRIQDDYEAGDAAALEACRDFIIEQLQEGRWFADVIDMSGTEPVPLYLAFRHRIEVDLPRFAFRLGRAIHALEDGYAHTLRNPDTGEVRHVTNWIDFSTSDDYDRARDGFEHLSTVDDCLRNTSVERYHLNQAEAAVSDLLLALADPGGDGNARLARVEAVLDRAFTIEPGCTYANSYCDAPELGELDGGCSAGGAGAGLLVVLGFLGLRRRKRIRPVFLTACLSSTAIAGPNDPEPQPALVWHGDFRFGAALDHAALAFMGGAGVDHGRWTYGLSLEWNPFFSLETSRSKPGALNVYASLARRWYDGERFALYSRAEVGTSTMLFDVVGVDQWDTGLYLGGALLGVAVKKHHGLRVVFDPSHYVVPIPRLTGLPFYYRQYRISIGLEYRFE
jgi:hypothetical protein